MKRSNEIRVHLHIVDFHCDPDEISSLLEIAPDETWRKGDPVDPRLAHKCPNNGWELRSGLSPTRTLNDQAKAILEKLDGREHRFKDIPEGAYIELSCYVHVYDYVPEMHFELAVVQGLAALGAAIDIDFYYLIENDDET